MNTLLGKLRNDNLSFIDDLYKALWSEISTTIISDGGNLDIAKHSFHTAIENVYKEIKTDHDISIDPEKRVRGYCMEIWDNEKLDLQAENNTADDEHDELQAEYLSRELKFEDAQSLKLKAFYQLSMECQEFLQKRIFDGDSKSEILEKSGLSEEKFDELDSACLNTYQELLK